MPVPARLTVNSLSKTFGSARVLTDVELTVLPGVVHGLAGPNGSGKSTLIKILTGLYTPDPGASYEVDGRAMRLPVRWPDVHAAGISVVHQDLGLLDQLTVAENICVGGYPTSRLGRIDGRRRDALAARTLDRLGVTLAADAIVATLTAAERAEVAIARAMRDQNGDQDKGAGLIILDESTRALSGADLDRVHQLLRRIAADGGAALMISHSLPELIAVTDRITILRDGRLAAAGEPTAELTEQEIARLMVGTSVAAVTRRPEAPASVHRDEVTVTGLHGAHLREVSFSVAKGEVLGLTGLPGSGYEDLPYLLTGARKAAGGELRTSAGTVRLARASVAACLRAGVVLVPERRDRDGLAFDLSVADNISLPVLRGRGRPWFVSRRWQREDAETSARDLDIRPRTPSILIKELSGGNQQKVLLAKWMNTGPALLVLHEPTQAVDIGARTDILRQIQRAADSGVSVLLVSSEPEDLVATCDRVLVYGREVGLRDARATTTDELIDMIYATNAATAGSPA
jgi:ribose transport system ATP-binding protein